MLFRSMSSLVAYVNAITKEKIATVQNEQMMSEANAFFPEADIFETVEGEYSAMVADVYLAKTGEDILGVCVRAVPIGFGGEMSILVGIDKDGAVISARILDDSETAGLGSKAKELSFIGQYNGKTGPFEVVKTQTGAENEIITLTGATITSKAVSSGVYEAVKTAQVVLANF